MSYLTRNELWKLFINNVYNSKFYKPVFSYDVKKPVVSDFLLKHGFMPEYPGGRRFAAIISHDIDFLNEPISGRTTTKKCIKSILSLKLKQSYELLNNFITYKNPDNYKIEKLIDYLISRNLTSTFYFLALDEGDDGFQYQLEEQNETLQLLLKNGFEIGLHGSHNACYSFEKIVKERERFKSVLGFTPLGYRNHMLNFDLYNTWKYLEKAAFWYDTSLGFNNTIGFRSGMSFPYNPYCERDGRFLDTLEFPLNIMDVVFSKYLNYGFKESAEAGINLIDSIIKQKGVVSVLWHHNHFSREKQKLLDMFLEHIKAKGGWITTYKDFICYWKKNSYNIEINNMIKTLLRPDS